MTASRTKIAVLAAVIAAAAGAPARGGDQATAPPRTLGASAASESEPQPSKAEPPPTAKKNTENNSGFWGEDQPPDVDTSDLKSDVPEPAESGPATPAAPSAAPSAAPQPAPAKVEEQSLGALEGPAVGLLGPANGGFEENIWSDSKRSDIEFLLPRIPLASQDSAVRALARRLVLTKADAPMGNIVRPIVSIRIEKLLEAGLADDAAALALQADLHDNPDFERLKADAILTADRADDACGPATASRLTQSGQFWLQLRTYCAAISGDSATAEITRNVLDAQKLGDAAFDVMLNDVLTKAKKAPGPLAKPTAMHFFLMRRAGLPVSVEFAKRFGAPADLVVLRDEHQKPLARLAAAEAIVKTGAASIVELRTVLDARSFAPDRIAKAQATAAKLPFLEGQGLLRRAAQLESRAPAKASLLHQALIDADEAGMFETAARLQADVAGKLDPEAVASSDAPLIGWALLIANKPEAAAKFLGNNEAAQAVVALVSGKGDTAAPLAAVARQFSADPKAPDRARTFEALVLSIADVLGAPMSAEAHAAAKSAEGTHWPGRRLDSQQLETIVGTSTAPGRKGEAILRILEAIGPEGPRDLAPDVVAELMHALVDMGMKDMARPLGLHALLLYRPGTS